MKTKYVTLLALLCLCVTSNAFAQRFLKDAIVPEVNKPMLPFTFYNLEHPTKEKVTLQDYKGKWLFLSFWYRGCSASVKNLSLMNDLQRQFKNEIHILNVGENGKISFGKGVRPLYERLQKHMHWEMPVVYDSIWSNRWNIHSFPHIIIVDPKGMVRVITTGSDMTAKKVRDLIDGKKVNFDPKDIDRPLFDPFHYSDGTLFGSQLVQWNGEQQFIPDIYGSDEGKAGIRVSRIPLEGLYNLAFIGKWQWLPSDSLYRKAFPHPIWEINQEGIQQFDYITGKGIYNYELAMPAPKSKEEIMAIMQMELHNTFGFEAALDEREMPVWKLVALKGASQKLKTKGGAPGFTVDIEADGGAGGFGYRNFPMVGLLDALIRFAPDVNIPYIDETNILHNIDIDMNVAMIDADAVMKELKRNGLELVLSKKRMKVVVIRDQKVTN